MLFKTNMTYNPKDHYFKKAKDLNFAARSVFKLEEIDQKHRIIKPNQKILDLGASPGSWSQYCSQKIGSNGRVLGIDLTEIKIKLHNAKFIQADLRDLNIEQSFIDCEMPPPFDVIISDMAPKTTGIRITDQMRSVELVELAMDIANRYLKKDGNFVAKLFHCDDFSKLKEELKMQYKKFDAVKPDSTRKISKEIFLVGIGKK